MAHGVAQPQANLLHAKHGRLIHIASTASGGPLCGALVDVAMPGEIGTARGNALLCWICDDLLEGVDPLTGGVYVTPLEDQLFALLAKLPYKAYLQTLHWQWMHRLALDYYGETCVLCGTDRDVQVHHRTYERRGRELVSDLIVLCDKCHGSYHRAA